jgi:hypothetical protein
MVEPRPANVNLIRLNKMLEIPVSSAEAKNPFSQAAYEGSIPFARSTPSRLQRFGWQVSLK